MFGSVDNFMAMVRKGFMPVYRPRSVQFDRLVAGADGLIQIVRLIGPDGEPVTALYSMELDADGNWRISGCQLVQDAQEV